jgi:hypothetical protein
MKKTAPRSFSFYAKPELNTWHSHTGLPLGQRVVKKGRLLRPFSFYAKPELNTWHSHTGLPLGQRVVKKGRF